MPFDFDKAAQLISLCETDLFTGCFSESTIRADLQNRKTMDMYSTLGSSGRQTNELGSKRQFYIQELGTTSDCITTILAATRMYRASDTSLISRCERCKSQVNTLLDLVRNF